MSRIILGGLQQGRAELPRWSVRWLSASKELAHEGKGINGGLGEYISSDEVYGSLGDDGALSELTPYAPNSPYSASKASSDHLVRAWHKTYGLPPLITNCCNNYGPFHFPA